MSILTAKNITLPKSAFKEKEGVVVLPLKKWRIIETALEDLDMYRSRSLAGEIGKARREKATVSLNSLLKKHSI